MEQVPTLPFALMAKGSSYAGQVPPGARVTFSVPDVLGAGPAAADARRHSFDSAGFRWELRVQRETPSQRYLTLALACVSPSQHARAPVPGAVWETPALAFTAVLLAPPGRADPLVREVSPRKFSHAARAHRFHRFVRLSAVRRDYARPDGSCLFAVEVREPRRPHRPRCSNCLAGELLGLMLEEPDRSHADVHLSGADAGDPAVRAVRAHRCILSARSTYFSRMFAAEGFREGVAMGSPVVVTFDDISTRGLNIVIRYLYGERMLSEVILRDVELFLEVWKFAAVHFLNSLEVDLAELSSVVCTTGTEPEVDASEDDDGSAISEHESEERVPRFALIFSQAVMLRSSLARYNLARSFEMVYQFSIPCYAAVLKFSVEEFEALLEELAPVPNWLQLAKEWLAQDVDGRAKHGPRIIEAFGIDEMSREALADVSSYSFAKRYISHDAYFRIASKLAGPSTPLLPYGDVVSVESLVPDVGNSSAT